jgi:hypothetical protein
MQLGGQERIHCSKTCSHDFGKVTIEDELAQRIPCILQRIRSVFARSQMEVLRPFIGGREESNVEKEEQAGPSKVPDTAFAVDEAEEIGE